MGKNMRLFLVLFAACLAARGLAASELTGEWTAEIEGRRGDFMAITLDLKEEEGLVTGTVLTPDGEHPVSSGSFDGESISFSVVTEIDGYQTTQRYRGTLEDDVIHFEVTAKQGRCRAAQVRAFEATRAS